MTVDFLFLPKARGVFKGGIGPWPPFWVARIANLYRKVSKIETCPPSLCKLGIRLLAGNLSDFRRKTGRNLSEDLFFSLHLILGEKWDKI